MIPWWWAVIALFAGAMIGAFSVALTAAGRGEYDRLEYERERNRIIRDGEGK